MTETEAREIAAPDSWPWPMSQEAQRWVEKSTQRTRFQCVARGCDGCMVCEPQKFNRAEHERFMRGL